MSFLFKSKKHQSSNALPPATRNIHTSEGTTPTPGPNGIRDKDVERLTQSPTPSANPNNSLSSLNGATNSPDHGWQRQRERADSDNQVSVPPVCDCEVSDPPTLLRHEEATRMAPYRMLRFIPGHNAGWISPLHNRIHSRDMAQP